MTIKPIETYHAGYRFRSRAEAPYSYDPLDWETANAGFVVDQPEIQEAYSAARMARFEHGERGVA